MKRLLPALRHSAKFSLRKAKENLCGIRFGFLVLCILVSCIVPARATEQADIPQSSLFFSPQQAHEAEMLARAIAPVGKGDIHLGAVLYYGPDDWTLWLQGEKWTPETSRENLQILEVTANDVRLSFHGEDDAEPHFITLQPNQSYQISTGRIISER